MAETSSQLKMAALSQESDSPEVLRAQIKETRAHMSGLVDELQVQLAPDRLAQAAKQKIKEATVGKVEEMAQMATHKAENWRLQVMQTVKQNPIPAALVGIGLGWLLMENSRSSSYNEDYAYPKRYYDTPGRASAEYGREESFMAKAQSAVGENVEAVQEKAGEMAQNVQHKLGEVAENVQTKTGEVASNLQAKAGELTSAIQSTVADQSEYLTRQAQYQARRAKEGFQTSLEENPLTVGAVAIAAGAAIGLMLPTTQKEDELMGETRDRLLEQAQNVAKETWKKVEHGAEKAYQVVTEEAGTAGNEEETKRSATSFSRSY